MAWKVVTFLALFALSEARPPTSEQRVKIENRLSHIGSHEPVYDEVYAWEYPSYEFSYEVSDPHTHDFKGQHEQRKYDEVKGYYWLIQPDGLKRTVKYRGDKHNGFKADVHYTKHSSWIENRNKHDEGIEEETNIGDNRDNDRNDNSRDNESIIRNENEDEDREERERENDNNSGNEEREGERDGEEREEEDEREGDENNTEVQNEAWEGEVRRLDINRGNHGRRNNHENRGTDQWGRENESKHNNNKGHISNVGARGRGNELNGGLKATTGIWRPNRWNKRHRHEGSLHREERKGSIDRGEELAKENKDSQEGHHLRNEKNYENDGGARNVHKSGETIKTEYHIIVHHPKFIEKISKVI